MRLDTSAPEDRLRNPENLGRTKERSGVPRVGDSRQEHGRSRVREEAGHGLQPERQDREDAGRRLKLRKLGEGSLGHDVDGDLGIRVGPQKAGPRLFDIHMKDLADDAAGLIDALDIDSAHVVGISMGGMIAQHVALRHPNRVDGLVLLATTPGRRS